jgi:hypothetical protein
MFAGNPNKVPVFVSGCGIGLRPRIGELVARRFGPIATREVLSASLRKAELSMHTFSQRILGDVKAVGQALKLEPGIRPSFSKATISTIIQVMFAAMMNRDYDAAGLYRYLEARDCPFDRETIDFLLNAFEGDDPDHHLWSRGSLGEYDPLPGAIPAWS